MRLLSMSVRTAGRLFLVPSAIVALHFPETSAETAPRDLLDTPAPAQIQPTRHSLTEIASVGERFVAVGANGLVLLSDDEGQIWRQAQVDVSVHLTALAFDPSGVLGIAVGHDGVILRSLDRGETWQRAADGRSLFKAVINEATERRDAAQLALDGATDETRRDLEFALEDEQYRLETAETSLEYGPAWPLLTVLVLDERTAWAAGAYNTLFETRDGGATWAYIGDRLDNFDALHLNALILTSEGTLLIGGEGGMIHRSADQGERFERYDTDTAHSVFGIVETVDEDGAVLIGHGFGDSFQISSDDGRSWQSGRLSETMILLGSIELTRGRVGLLGNEGRMIEIGRREADIAILSESQPLGNRAFLSGAMQTPDGLRFISEEGVSEVVQ
ncbi:MAG: hypothetical protein AAFV62_04425 [Pseudomonadota bacterium]